MFESKSREEAAAVILDQVKAYYQTFMRKASYREGDRIPYASRVFDENELVNLVDSSLEFWLASGRYTDRFEKQFAEYLQVPFCSLVNSGSSANLLAFMALTFVRPAERFGALAIATNGSVVSFNEKLGGDYAEDRIVPYCVRAA